MSIEGGSPGSRIGIDGCEVLRCMLAQGIKVDAE